MVWYWWIAPARPLANRFYWLIVFSLFTRPPALATPPVPNEIYAQVMRSSSQQSKLVKFMDTIGPLHERHQQEDTGSWAPIRLFYNVGFKQGLDSGPLAPVQFSIDHNRKCFSVLHSTTAVGPRKRAKLFAFDHIFEGSLSSKLRTIPRIVLADTVDAIVGNHLSSVVILAIDDQLGDHRRKSPVVEFRELTHRALMLHSIKWLFEAITDCRSHTTVKLSAMAVFHHKLIDMIQSSEQPSGPLFTSVKQEILYPVENAAQAASYLERSLEHYSKLQQLLLDNCEQLDCIFVFTLHLFRYEPVADKQGNWSKFRGQISQTTTDWFSGSLRITLPLCFKIHISISTLHFKSTFTPVDVISHMSPAGSEAGSSFIPHCCFCYYLPTLPSSLPFVNRYLPV